MQSKTRIDHDRFTRRSFLVATAASTLAIAVPRLSAATLRRLSGPVRIGVIADLHHDVMHDGIARMEAFVGRMADVQPDALLQLGDFAYPNARNRDVIDLFNQAHDRTLHVIGNHDTDSGHTQQECLDVWGMPARYYSRNVEGIQFLVLDGNDRGSPTFKSGYPSYIGEEQTTWLKNQLAALDGPAIVVCHQPLAGAWAIDNAEEVQAILANSADKILLAINGHSHIDSLLRVKGVTYLHVNSASYQWVGGDYRHESYSREVHKEHSSIASTCPYRDPLFATLKIDPQTMTIHLEGRQSEWVGKSPAELGRDLDPGLTNGEEITPGIRDRLIERIAR